MRYLLMPLLALALVGCSPTDARQPAAAPTTMPEHAAKEKQPATMPEHTAKAKPQSATVADPAAKEKQIVIDNFTFDPPDVTIPAGTRVTWVNHDDVPHTATGSTKPRAFDSGTLDTDEKYSFVFKTEGVYEYFCAVHPKMTGKITVTK